MLIAPASSTFTILVVSVAWECRFDVLDILPTPASRRKYEVVCGAPVEKTHRLGEDRQRFVYMATPHESYVVFLQVHAPSGKPFTVRDVRGFQRRHRLRSREEILGFKPERSSHKDLQARIDSNFVRKLSWDHDITFV